VKSYSAHDPSVVARLRSRGGCGCHTPAEARVVAERTMRAVRGRRMREGNAHEMAFERIGVEPIILAAKDGSKCLPCFTVQTDQDRFAACNALADEIGPLDSTEKAAQLIGEAIGNEINEVFGLLTLDLHLRHKHVIATGRGESAAVMAPMVPTLQAALIDSAYYVILFHCHPSGVEAEPSDADKETTKAFADAFGRIDVRLLDHIIVSGGRESFFSFVDAGLLSPPEDL
jgi:hypothetical protein